MLGQWVSRGTGARLNGELCGEAQGGAQAQGGATWSLVEPQSCRVWAGPPAARSRSGELPRTEDRAWTLMSRVVRPGRKSHSVPVRRSWLVPLSLPWGLGLCPPGW